MPWTVAHQAPLTMEFLRQEYWIMLPFPTPVAISCFLAQGSKPHLLCLLHWQADSLLTTLVVQSLGPIQLFATPWTVSLQAPRSFTISWCLLKFMSIESMMLFNHLILCHSLLLLPSLFPSIRVLSSESALQIRWPQYYSFSYSISPSNEYSWLSSFRIDSFNLLAFQGTLKSFLQHHSLKASILRHSAFFMVQLSHCIGKIVYLP